MRNMIRSPVRDDRVVIAIPNRAGGLEARLRRPGHSGASSVSSTAVSARQGRGVSRMFVRRWLSWLAAWLVVAAVVSVAGAAFPQVADEGADEGRHAQTPLSEIAGAAAPPPVTVVPLEEVPSVQTAVEQARAWIEDGRFQDAVEALSGALEETGGDRYEVHYLLALAKTRLGQFDAARVSAEAAARLGHGDANVHYLLGQIYRGHGETEAAIAHYRSATLAAERELNNPKVTRAWYSLGQLLEQGGYDLAAAEAYAQFDTALWQTHPEQRNAPEFAALLAQRPYGMVPQRWEMLVRLGRERAGCVWPSGPTGSGPTTCPWTGCMPGRCSLRGRPNARSRSAAGGWTTARRPRLCCRSR